MAGYSGYSKSNNAIYAEAQGRFPLSVVAKKTRVPSELIKEYVKPSEWHHSSKFFNKIDYYDVEEILAVFGKDASDEFDANPRAIEALANWRPAKKEGVRHSGCTVEWLEWSGSRNHPRATECRAENVDVTIAGSFAAIHLKTGDIRKKVDANRFSIKIPTATQAVSEDEQDKIDYPAP